jgi:hypothetical protein
MHTRFGWVNLERRRLLGSSRHSWGCNIKGIGQEGMEWINVAQYKDKWWANVKAVMNLQVP